MRSTTHAVSHETVLEDGKPIVTTTDLKAAAHLRNSTFLEASGYADEELRGAAKHAVPPDMPPQVDADMWRTVLSGEPWRGLVKYAARTAAFLGIANVTPVIEKGRTTGFMSVCTKPKREQIQEAAQLYRTLKGPTRTASPSCAARPRHAAAASSPPRCATSPCRSAWR
jgi:aerotaxis receptor